MGQWHSGCWGTGAGRPPALCPLSRAGAEGRSARGPSTAPGQDPSAPCAGSHHPTSPCTGKGLVPPSLPLWGQRGAADGATAAVPAPAWCPQLCWVPMALGDPRPMDCPADPSAHCGRGMVRPQSQPGGLQDHSPLEGPHRPPPPGGDPPLPTAPQHRKSPHRPPLPLLSEQRPPALAPPWHPCPHSPTPPPHSQLSYGDSG